MIGKSSKAAQTLALALSRRRAVEARTGNSRSALYDKIGRGVFPPPVRIGKRAVAWLDHEVDALIRAQARGIDEKALRQLVVELLAARDAGMR